MIFFKHYDVPQEPQAALILLKELWADVNQDDRHPLWLVEGAAEGIQAELQRVEKEILSHKEFGRSEREADSRTRHQRLTRDIRLLGCLHTVLVHRKIELDAQALAAYFQQQSGTDRASSKQKRTKRPPDAP